MRRPRQTSPNAARPRRGFTLAEVMVFGALAVVVLGLVWGLVRDAARGSVRVEGKLQAVEATLLAGARLARDLELVEETPGARPSAQVGAARTVLRLPPAPVGGGRPAVTYTFDAAEGSLRRQLDGEDPDRLPGRFEAFLVRLVEPGGDEGASVLYSLVGVGGAAEPAAPNQGPARGRRAVLVGGAPREAAAGRQRYPAWNRVVLTD